MARPEIIQQRKDDIARREEAGSFEELVEEYSALGYSEYSVARRLLNIDVGTMRQYLDGYPVAFKRPGETGYKPWNDPKATSMRSARRRIENGKGRMLTHNGETLHLNEWARRTGIAYTTIARRIDHSGWTVGDALTVPVNARRGAINPHRPKQKRGALEWIFA